MYIIVYRPINSFYMIEMEDKTCTILLSIRLFATLMLLLQLSAVTVLGVRNSPLAAVCVFSWQQHFPHGEELIIQFSQTDITHE